MAAFAETQRLPAQSPPLSTLFIYFINAFTVSIRTASF